MGLGLKKRLGGVISIQYFHLFYYFIFALEPGPQYEVQTTYYIGQAGLELVLLLSQPRVM